MSEQDLSSLSIDTTTPNVARIYDHLLGGKDNISQVVSGRPHTDRTGVIQACQGGYSNTGALAVRELCSTSMGFMSDFSDEGS